MSSQRRIQDTFVYEMPDGHGVTVIFPTEVSAPNTIDIGRVQARMSREKTERLRANLTRREEEAHGDDKS